MASPIGLLQEGAPPVRLWLIPAGSVVAGSLASLLPAAADVTVFPSFGLLMLLGWRLLRPEMQGAWIALPLGLADDLIGGAPLGSAMTLWTVVLLGLDIADTRLVWRDRLADWGLAAIAITFGSGGQWAIAGFTGGAAPLWSIAPPIVIGMLCFPLAVRLCAGLDRTRLGRR